MGSMANNIFAIVGFQIGKRPLTVFCVASLVFLLSLTGFVYRLNLNMGITNGFVRQNAPSFKEVGAHIEFFGNLGEPWYLALFASPKNKSSSALNVQEAYEIRSFYKTAVNAKLTDEITGKEFRYGDENNNGDYLCEPFCTFNKPLWTLLTYTSYFHLTYPLASIEPFKVNIGKYLFERTVDENGVIQSVKTVAIYFTTFFNGTTKARRLAQFEKNLLRLVAEHNAAKNNTVNFLLHGAYPVAKEVGRGIAMTLPYNCRAAIIFVILTAYMFVVASSIYNQWYYLKISLIIAEILCPVLAAVSAIGYGLLFGFHINMFLMLAPFLAVLALSSLNNSLLIMNSWMMNRDALLEKEHTPIERMQLAVEKIGVSLTISALSGASGFALSCSIPIPEIWSLCAIIALSIVLNLFYQLTLYAPLLVLIACKQPTENSYKAVVNNGVNMAKCIFVPPREKIQEKIKLYSNVLASLWTELLVTGLVIVYILGSLYGIRSMETNMNLKLLLPPDSLSNEGVRMINEVVWPDFLSINYIIRSPPDFSDPKQYRDFMHMIETIERSEYAVGRAGNMVWIFDFLRYLTRPEVNVFDIFWGNQPIIVNEEDALEKGLNMIEFEKFINTEPFDAWKSGVHYAKNSENQTVVTEMLLMVGYKGTRSLKDKVRLLPICRDIVRRYPEYNMKVFDTDAYMVDVLLDLPYTLGNIILYIVICTGIIFLLFSWNIATAFVSSLSVASICIGILGLVYYWQNHLDLLAVSAILMCTIIAIEYTVHIIYHYLNSETEVEGPKERISATFNTCGIPLIQTSVTILLATIISLYCPIGIYANVSKIVVSAVIVGLIHGLLFVPTLLGALPQCFIGRKCCANAEKE